MSTLLHYSGSLVFGGFCDCNPEQSRREEANDPHGNC